MHPHPAQMPATDAHPGFGPALFEGLREAGHIIWNTTGPSLVAAGLAYLVTYHVTVHLCRGRQGGLSRSDQRDIHFIAILAGVATWVMVQGREYLWEHYRGWIAAFGFLLAAAIVGLVWATERRIERLSRHRLGRLGTPEGLQKLSPRDFELACAELFRSLGYQVKVTPPQSDKGADLVVTREGVRGIVECKHYLGERKVSGPALQKLLGAKEYHRATEAFLVTSGELTEAAWDVARKATHLHVWRRPELERRVLRLIDQEPSAPDDEAPNNSL